MVHVASGDEANERRAVVPSRAGIEGRGDARPARCTESFARALSTGQELRAQRESENAVRPSSLQRGKLVRTGVTCAFSGSVHWREFLSGAARTAILR